MTSDDVYRKVRKALIAARREADEERVSATAYYEVLHEALQMHTNNADSSLIIRRLNSQSAAAQRVLHIIRKAGESE
jgi:TnpA family transposase